MVRAYIPNPGFEEEWLASEDALELVAPIAEAAATQAEQLAPEDYGYLKDSIEAEVGLVNGVATGRVNAHDFKAAWHEFGTINNPATPFLRTSMESVTGQPLKGSRR